MRVVLVAIQIQIPLPLLRIWTLSTTRTRTRTVFHDVVVVILRKFMKKRLMIFLKLRA